MPWPKPKPDETEREFIDRCMGNEYIQSDLPTQAARLAVCYRRWEDRDRSLNAIRDESQEVNMEMQYKRFTGCELKKEKAGAFTARIATLKVVDKDGDVTLPGAFPVGKEILISSYMHGSWMGGLPVGKGTIREEGDDVLVDGQFNLNTETGKEHYETVKFAPELQEWSYGFIVNKEGDESDWPEEVPGRILKLLDVFEASPVLRGAGENTVTLAIKSEGKGAISYNMAHAGGCPMADMDAEWDAAKEMAAAEVEDLMVMCAWVESENKDKKGAYKLPHHRAEGEHALVWKGVAAAMAALMGGRGGVDIPERDRRGVYNHLKKHYAEFEKEPPEFHAYNEGTTFAANAETVLAAVLELADRSKSLADLRRKEGRDLSTANRERIAGLLKALNEVAAGLKDLLDSTEPNSEKARRLYLQYLKIENELKGATT